MEEGEAVLQAHERIVEEASPTRNVRPRAGDLNATCCSTASHEFERDAELRARMLRIRDELYPRARNWPQAASTS